ncbi:MAG TPA: 2'-5' RNA ligase family protein [Acidimicrobiales bacterium]|nr:2'-5' RNA ligase family protein [Acidimicrobiales bacterium]
MPRARLGVALLLPHPVAAEVDGLRRALGDGALERIAAHITLVPPVNVDLARLDEAEATLRQAGGAGAPLELTLGPPTAFWPATPVVYLAVGGDLEELRALRDRVFAPPLQRRLTYEFVPHVTLADEVAEERIGPALSALADYRRPVRIDRVDLLREEAGRRWTSIAQAALGPARVVGRGGLPVELAVIDRAADGDRWRAGSPERRAVVARRQGEVVGVAEAVVGPDGALDLVSLSVAEGERATGVGSRLLDEVLVLAAALQCGWVRVAPGHPDLAGFLGHRGFTAGPAGRPAGGLLWRRI